MLATRMLVVIGLTLVAPQLTRAESFACRDDGTPVERILVNLESQASASQGEWGWHENLGRLHALAYAQKTMARSSCWESWSVTRGVATPLVVGDQRAVGIIRV